jgi:hypothetical protein
MQFGQGANYHQPKEDNTAYQDQDDQQDCVQRGFLSLSHGSPLSCR